ncbi:hypothetical protein Igag_0741 [Ignisphaera aggregans DSM 17230]|uniref:Uncharacterized protein n=1 Tax=Ignisphaera aggregans (strain DSM 17230 / JCM 13409 / AQ1.S1) TaxID=583356 RepID=E0ST94_IGNAA|nr:hypothetical protein Igag_0741 [Ignisphaera aggregans DSM 17230]
MNEEVINALIYGFLGALGVMLLSSASSTNDVLSAPWIGAFLCIYGFSVAVFYVLERISPSDEHQEVITIILLLIVVGISVMRFGIDVPRIVGAIALSIALGRAFALIINLIIDLTSHLL